MQGMGAGSRVDGKRKAAVEVEKRHPWEARCEREQGVRAWTASYQHLQLAGGSLVGQAIPGGHL